MPVLSTPQSAALAALEWLHAPDYRQTGRTTVLAIAVIRAALRRPGETIPIRDHGGNRTADRMLAVAIYDLVTRDPQLRGQFYSDWLTTVSRDPRLCFLSDTPSVSFWLPRDWTVEPGTLTNPPPWLPATPSSLPAADERLPRRPRGRRVPRNAATPSMNVRLETPGIAILSDNLTELIQLIETRPTLFLPPTEVPKPPPPKASSRTLWDHLADES